MTTFRLVTFRDQPTGELGLGLEGHQHHDDMFAARDGRLIAHDIVEHPDTHSIGSVESELMALGAAWECRGRWVDINRNGMGSMYSPEESIAADYEETFRYFFYREGCCIAKPKVTRASHHTASFDDAMVHMMEIFHKYVRADGVGDDADAHALQKFKNFALHYGRMGIRRYLARWGEPLWGNTVFWNIASEVDRIINYIDFEGQEFDLRVIKKTGRVFINEVVYDY